jgi:HEAT repeat-containing taxis protein
MIESGSNGRDVYSIIEQFGDRTDQERRIRAASALGELGDPRAVSALIEGLRDSDPEVRKHAARALLALRSVRAVDALVERLKDSNECWITRRLAAESLRRIKGYRAMAALADYQKELETGTIAVSVEQCPMRRWG